MSHVPTELFYTKDHEWIRIDAGMGTVGITDHAQHALGDVVFVELPKAGALVAAGKPFGSVESVKAVSEIYCPMSGEVVEVNGALESSPETLNRDPYGAGWIARIRISQPSEAEGLLRPDAYATLVAEEH